MSQEDKELLLKDLCSRLPYGVICKCLHSNTVKATAIDTEDLSVYYFDCDEWESIEHCKPYLRSMSSMTEEEKKEMHEKLSPKGTAVYKEEGISTPLNHHGEWIPYEYMSRIINWLLKNHFDYCGLIDKGLAIAVTEENNPYKE